MNLNSVTAIDSGGCLSISLHLRLLVHMYIIYIYKYLCVCTSLSLHISVYHLWIVESKTKWRNIRQMIMARFGYIGCATRTTPDHYPINCEGCAVPLCQAKYRNTVAASTFHDFHDMFMIFLPGSYDSQTTSAGSVHPSRLKEHHSCLIRG